MRTGSLNTAFLVQAIGWILPALYLGMSLIVSGVDSDIDWAALARLAPLTAVLLGVGYIVHYRGLEVGSVSVVSAVTSAWLLISVLLAALFLDEAVTSPQWALILGVTGGIVLLSLQRGSHAWQRNRFLIRGRSHGVLWHCFCAMETTHRSRRAFLGHSACPRALIHSDLGISTA